MAAQRHEANLMAYGAISLTVLCIASGAVFVRYLSQAYEPFTQCLVRYTAAFLFLLPFVLMRRSWSRSLWRRAWRAMAVVGLLNFGMMTFWATSLYAATATATALLFKLHVPFVILLSFLLFHEERRVIRHPLFLAGSVFGGCGVIGVMVRDPGSMLPEFGVGAWLAIAAAVFWALYSVTGRHVIREVDPLALFAAVAGIDALLFLGMSVIFESPRQLLEGGWGVGGVAVASGIIGVVGGHLPFHYSQRHLGAAFSNLAMLLTPLFTHLFAILLWKDEALNRVQWLGTALLLGGTGLVLYAQFQSRSTGLTRP